MITPSDCGHGLYYVTRDGMTLQRLDLDPPGPSTGWGQQGTPGFMIQGAERAVMLALLRHALAVIERADAENARQ